MDSGAKTAELQVIPVPGIPLIEPGTDLVSLICDIIGNQGPALRDGDVLVVAQKIVATRQEYCCVVINDSFGRAWRLGTVGLALGAAGLPARRDLRGEPNLYDRPRQVTETGFADEIAAAALLLMGQADEATPIVVVRGLKWSATASPAAQLLRDPRDDLFR